MSAETTDDASADVAELETAVTEAIGKISSGRTSANLQSFHVGDGVYIEVSLTHTPRQYAPVRIVTAVVNVLEALDEARAVTIYTHAEDGPSPIRCKLTEDDVQAALDIDDDTALRFHIFENADMSRVI